MSIYLKLFKDYMLQMTGSDRKLRLSRRAQLYHGQT